MPLYVTFALMLLCFTSINATRLVLSLYALDLGAQPFAVSMLYATFYAFPVVISWPIGSYSDRVGSRWLLLFGSIFGVIACVIPYFWRELAAVYVAGALVGLSFSFYLVLLQNIVGLLSRPEERARNFSNASLVGATTGLIGPVLAGVAIDRGGNAIASLSMVVFPLLAAGLLVLRGGLLPGAARRATATESSGLVRPAMLRTLLTSALVQLGQDIHQLYVPIYGHGIGLSGSAIGAVLACFAAAAFVSRVFMPRLIGMLGEGHLLGYSMFVAAIGFVLMPLFQNVGLLGAVSFLIGLGMGCGQPITTMLIFAQSAGGRSGSALGLRQTVNNVVRMSGPALFGVIAAGSSILAVFWINAVLMGAGGWLARREHTARSR